jgi:hypothetical protein
MTFDIWIAGQIRETGVIDRSEALLRARGLSREQQEPTTPVSVFLSGRYGNPKLDERRKIAVYMDGERRQ